ncbi:conjugal transfer protein [Chromobacterium haemolyticum]|uniref:Conjugal transfer protein n=1 Tax=Chromobacterium fluminis TaxID=3044269 RepID=A0ABX0L7L8_9NEIS|nr:conjugal transfer protein [Chromobacterium haemolyticum]NHR07809.1 conjugal transfer protein [Chromobacterium haemolyticum]
MRTKLFVLLIFNTVLSAAEDLGKQAPTFAPEKDAREQIKEEIRKKEKSGQLAKFWQDYRAKTIDSIKHPAPLGIKTSYGKRQELRELRFTVPSDYRDIKGKVIVRKGAVIEPLKITPLKTGLIFIDGRDQKQVNYAINKGRSQPLKIVLTAGSPFDLRVKYQGYSWPTGQNIPFYFDQRKAIINSFKMLYGINLNSVPVILSQKGDKLLLEYGM